MTSNFDSITQYDKQFDDPIDKIICGKGYACSLFGILTPWKFMQGQFPNKHMHEQTIKDAVKASRFLDMAEGLTFADLLGTYTNLDSGKINGTCVDLIVNKILGFDVMFPKIENDGKYAVIFLKNEKYIVVLVDKDGYYLRDCHESTQHNFKDLDSLVKHLSEAYQFVSGINIGGVEYSDYSSIEFINITEKFNTLLSSLLAIDGKPFDISNDDIFNMPDNKILSKDDISYLELLNEQLNGFGEYDTDNKNYKPTDFSKISIDYTSEFIDFD